MLCLPIHLNLVCDMHNGPLIISVSLEQLPNGGLRATCDKVPELLLSNCDPEAVIADIAPSLEVILSAKYGRAIAVEQAAELGDELPPAYMCSSAHFVGSTQAH